ncbi:helix-turn-helix domain-containing protein [Planococcus sp. APC 4015]|nr:helix-turn-helix domain-containing protein [Planococcus sp. APC 4015]
MILQEAVPEYVPSTAMLRDWMIALGATSPVPVSLIDEIRARPGHMVGTGPLPGRVTNHTGPRTLSALAAVYGDIYLATACGPTASWTLDASDQPAVLLVVSLVGRLRVRAGDQTSIVAPGTACFVTSSRSVTIDGIEASGSLLVGMLPAARMRRVHTELAPRGPLPVGVSPTLRAAIAYAGTLLIATLTDDEPSALESGDALASIVESLAEFALAAEGRGSRSGEVRQAAMRCIEEQHREHAFGVDDIARELFISRRQLYRAFPDEGGIAGIIAARRVKTAERIMADRPTLQLSEVATMAGFSTAGVMRAHFRRTHGTTPQRHRDAALNARGAEQARGPRALHAVPID